MNNSEIWNQTLNNLRGTMTKATFETVLSGSLLLSTNGRYTIQATSEMARDWLQNRFRGHIAKSLTDCMGADVFTDQLEFVVKSNELPALNGDDDDGPIYIRDMRKLRWYRIDNEFVLLGYAAHIGPYAVAVYNALCCRADNQTQTCYPGKAVIALDTGMSKEQVKRCLKVLEQYRLIHVLREQRENSEGWKSNTYTLLDVSQWSLLDCDPDD